MDQLITLGLSMPPIVSACMSVLTLLVLWFGSKRILRELEGQSRELKVQSKDLVDIKIQTARTNGRVLALEDAFEVHGRTDDEHHADAKAGLLLNRSTLHKLRDQLSEFAIKVGLQEKRVGSK